MKLQTYDPLRYMEQFHNDINRLMGTGLWSGGDGSNIVTSGWTPAVDVKEEKNRFVVTADIPGVDPKDIDVTMENGALTIRGERNYESEDKDEDNGYTRIERSYGTFYRRLALPDVADAENISAQGKNGVLQIVIPKSEKAKPRRIEIRS